jgi:glutathione peroxidase-family protein
MIPFLSVSGKGSGAGQYFKSTMTGPFLSLGYMSLVLCSVMVVMVEKNQTPGFSSISMDRETLAASSFFVAANEDDDDDVDTSGHGTHEEAGLEPLHCDLWADTGECDTNPDYMLHFCKEDCDRVAAASSTHLLDGITSFYDLKVNDIDGNEVAFEQFKGKVVIITNVASYCGYTKSHYEGLVELWSKVSDGNNVEILAFPCNQFGQQEPGTPQDIKTFVKERGVQFRMMEKINVNGPTTNVVYQYLKSKAGPDNIHWNFATYYVVDPSGDVKSYNGVEPMSLHEVAMGLLRGEEL